MQLVLSQGERLMTHRSVATSTLTMLTCLVLKLRAGGMLMIGRSSASGRASHRATSRPGSHCIRTSRELLRQGWRRAA